MRLPPFFDPDRDVLSVATLQHFAGSLLLCLLLDLRLGTAEAFAWTVILGACYELGQWDAARGLHVCHEGGDLKRPFKPGYGIGVMDIVADVVGAASYCGLVRILQ